MLLGLEQSILYTGWRLDFYKTISMLYQFLSRTLCIYLLFIFNIARRAEFFVAAGAQAGHSAACAYGCQRRVLGVYECWSPSSMLESEFYAGVPVLIKYTAV